MTLILSDWLIIALYFIVSAAIGLSTDPLAPPPGLKARTLARALGQSDPNASGRVIAMTPPAAGAAV